MRDGQARVRGRPASHVHVDRWNAQRRLSGAQRVLLVLGLALCLFVAIAFPGLAVDVLRSAGIALVSAVILLRVCSLTLARRPAWAPEVRWAALPRYTVIAPMYREGGVCPQLVAHLDRLIYPRDRLQVLLTLEADDLQTLAVLQAMTLPAGFEVFVAPPGWPKTKPRACNEALRVATGELLVIYDAEDRPEPMQLLEAASRFAVDPDIACFQAPLRIDHVRGFLGAQFAFEYAAQFETLLPALNRLGAPFPLGGSSNHFRMDALRALGGWDPHNVTEDADLGFRMAAAGLRCGLLTTPTWEEPPHALQDWIPQRSRWVKGHLQTWLVHMRRPFATGGRGFLAIQATLGLGVISATAHGPLAAFLLVEAGLRALGLHDPALGADEAALLATSWAAALASMLTGARRAGVKLSWRHALQAPLYWPLHSLAAGRAVWQFAFDPFRWDKTEHRPVPSGRPAP